MILDPCTMSKFYGYGAKIKSSFFSRYYGEGRLILSGICLSILSLTYSIAPSFAGDPFRTENPRPIGATTEKAFNALFLDGNYPQAKAYLDEAKLTEKNDPLVPALRASLAYTEEDWANMEFFADETVKVARALATDDPLRSNLYLAVGNFLQGAYKFQKQGPLAALTQLQAVFKHFERAEKIDANDPELSLIKGYFNLILAVNLPFSSPSQAISQLQQYASPEFLVNRGIAVAYRDLKDYDEALVFADKAIANTPDNPEIYYLRGQILREKGMRDKNVAILEQALENFNTALAKLEQMPVNATQIPLQRDHRATVEMIAQLKGNSSGNSGSMNIER